MGSRRWLRLLGHLTTTTTVTVVLLLTPVSSINPVDDDDLHTLLSFKSLITNDPSGALSSWSAVSNSSHGGLCRSWTGVTCSSSPLHPGRVAALRLRGLRLAGTISPLLGNLTRLRVLDLSGNKLEGEIPPSLGSCFALRDINLTANFLSGVVPPAIGYLSKLAIFSIGSNNISGVIPHSFANLTALTMFSIVDNSVHGQIPPWLANLTALTDLNIIANMMSGHVPPALSRLTNLQGLHIAHNKFEGVIDPSLFNMSSLEAMNFGSNNLSGSLPTNIGSTLPNLISFAAFYNQYEGEIPVSLLNVSFLERLILHGNGFQGRIPPNSGLNGRLTVFDVGNNNLQATVPKDWDFLTSLANCSNLIGLNFQLNNISGILPNIIVNLSQELDYILIGGNQISGHMPMGMGRRYYKLTTLQLARNLLIGSIPSDIGNLPSLYELELQENRISVEIPSLLGNITQLNLLDLSSNYLEGGIPVTFGNLTMLNTLDLSSNLLSGQIPPDIMRISFLTQSINLSNNALDGPISPHIGHLVNLGIVDLSSNKLSGEIPATIGSCLQLQFLYLQGNLLSGQIPEELNALKGLEVLDLSNNKLSGPIPEFLESFRLLTNLNLSSNHLSGPVPDKGIFSNASSVSLTSNDMLCGGPLFFHFPACRPSLAPDKPANHRMVHILIFSVVGAFISATICTGAYCCYKKPRGDVVAGQEQNTTFLDEVYQRISYTELCVATDSFSPENLIGRGSFGTVYAGTFSSTANLTTVAVKVLDLQQKGATRSFTSECNALKRVKHRKLVKIVTVCDSLDHRGDEFKALVLEFISNGSLDEWLHPNLEKPDNNLQRRHLTLMQRLNIAIDVAEALEYLHHRIDPCIVHCDVKPSNILLDNEMVAHVSDFGLAKIMSAQGSGQCLGESTSARIKGTIGYLAPEYGTGTEISIEGDIYSYGVLLLEMLSGRRPTDTMFEDITNLPKYVEMAYPDNLLEVMDANIPRSENPQDMIDMFMAPVSRLGLACCRGSARQRIKMSEVVKELSAIKKTCEIKYSPFVHPYDNVSPSSSL